MRLEGKGLCQAEPPALGEYTRLTTEPAQGLGRGKHAYCLGSPSCDQAVLPHSGRSQPPYNLPGPEAPAPLKHSQMQSPPCPHDSLSRHHILTGCSLAEAVSGQMTGCSGTRLWV